MKVSQNNQGLQKTKYLGSSAKDRVELEDKQRVHREFSATSNGGTRLLGIPTVLDRFIQQAIAQELNNIYDEKFSESSFGFRPRRGAKDAIKQAESYITFHTNYLDIILN